MPAIEVKGISKHFGQVAAVSDLDFEVPAGVCFGFLGPNGAGKTTLMKMLYGRSVQDRDCRGSIRVFGFDPRTQELAIKYRAGVVSQEDNLDDELDVQGNLRVYAQFYAMPSHVARQRIADLLEFMELSGKTTVPIKALSGGMKRRLVIARALLNGPRLLILDEPTTGLDPQVRHVIWDRLRQLKAQGTTILLTTHYMEEAFQLCDELVILHKGRRVTQGNPRDLVQGTIEPFVLELIGPESRKTLLGASLPDGVRAEGGQGMARLYSNSLDQLKTLADRLSVADYHLRQANLEDVFLKATGSHLDGR